MIRSRMSIPALAAVLIAPLFTGCISLTVGTSKETTGLEMNGPATGFADLNGIRPWDGTILRAHLLDDGELISLGVWPLAEVGIGLIGARAQVLPLEAGVGMLFYSPEGNKTSAFDAPKSSSDKPAETHTEQH